MLATHTLPAAPMPYLQPVAVLENVSKRYAKIIALDGLSLTLHPGEIVAQRRNLLIVIP